MASQILNHILAVVSQYSMPLTVRQIFYKLVTAGIIRNTRSDYNYLHKLLVKARIKGGMNCKGKIVRKSTRLLKNSF